MLARGKLIPIARNKDTRKQRKGYLHMSLSLPKGIILFLLLLLSALPTFAQDSPQKRGQKRGEAAGYSSRDATVLSVMGWGTGLAIGIATLSALLNDNSSSSHSH